MDDVPQTSETVDFATDSNSDVARLDPTSSPFVGRWHRLISTTNWEKGRIICQWRAALRAAGASPGQYTDEAWSQCVGGVSGQHVGRLRRVFERFGASCADYPGLFWSHFCAALDWNDAEMWLEGAVHNRWSVSRMRERRSRTLGEVAQTERDVDAAWSDPLDADAESGENAEPEREVVSSREAFFPAGPLPEGPDFGDEGNGAPDRSVPDAAPLITGDAATERTSEGAVRPFAALADLPDDLAEACEAFKLAILRHKLDNWRQIAADDVLACLAALQQLVLAK